MAKATNKYILWEISCEGHRDAWVTAPNWEQATLKAAEFWNVPWREVAARCELKKKTVGAPRNVCCRCGRIYFGSPPMCEACEKNEKLEEEELRRRIKRAYQMGRAM